MLNELSMLNGETKTQQFFFCYSVFIPLLSGVEKISHIKIHTYREKLERERYLVRVFVSDSFELFFSHT